MELATNRIFKNLHQRAYEMCRSDAQYFGHPAMCTVFSAGFR